MLINLINNSLILHFMRSYIHQQTGLLSILSSPNYTHMRTSWPAVQMWTEVSRLSSITQWSLAKPGLHEVISSPMKRYCHLILHDLISLLQQRNGYTIKKGYGHFVSPCNATSLKIKQFTDQAAIIFNVVAPNNFASCKPGLPSIPHGCLPQEVV